MGLATAKRFAKEGMDHVFITGRGKGALDAAAAEIGKNVTAVQGDVSNLGAGSLWPDLFPHRHTDARTLPK